MKVHVNVPSVEEFRAAGGEPEYAVTDWPGDWVLRQSDPVGQIVRLIDKAKALDLLPYMHDYYFGDDIRLAAVRGVSPTPNKGRTLEGQQKLVEVICEALRRRPARALIPIETEFNKADVMDDGGLAIDKMISDSAIAFKAVGALPVLSPGLWGEYEREPDKFLGRLARSVQACDFIGIQCLRSVPRNGASSYDQAPDVLLASAKRLHELTGDMVIITDIAVSSYGSPTQTSKPWGGGNGRAEEERQRRFWTRMVELKPQLAEHVSHVFPRSLRDTNMAPTNYHGYAEQHWGFVRQDGTRKPAFTAFMEFAKNAPETVPKAEYDRVLEALGHVTLERDAALNNAVMLADKIRKAKEALDG